MDWDNAFVSSCGSNTDDKYVIDVKGATPTDIEELLKTSMPTRRKVPIKRRVNGEENMHSDVTLLPLVENKTDERNVIDVKGATSEEIEVALKASTPNRRKDPKKRRVNAEKNRNSDNALVSPMESRSNEQYVIDLKGATPEDIEVPLKASTIAPRKVPQNKRRFNAKRVTQQANIRVGNAGNRIRRTRRMTDTKSSDEDKGS